MALLTFKPSLHSLVARESVAFLLAHVTSVLCHIATLNGGKTDNNSTANGLFKFHILQNNLPQDHKQTRCAVFFQDKITCLHWETNLFALGDVDVQLLNGAQSLLHVFLLLS